MVVNGGKLCGGEISEHGGELIMAASCVAARLVYMAAN